jgi:hypothetical protein
MSKRYTQVPITYLNPIFHEWRSAFDGGELVNVFFMPHGDILFRAMQFVDWARDTYGDDMRLINFESELIVNPENLKSTLHEYKDKKVVLVARREFMQPDAVSMAAVLEEWYATYGVGILVLHEGFPSELAHFVSRPVMTQKQLFCKIYPDNVIREYITTTAELFKVDVSSVVIDKLIDHCGGIPWLINDVIRRADCNFSELFEDTTFKWKVEQIAKSIPTTISGIESDLVRMGLKKPNVGWIPVLRDYFLLQSKNDLAINHDLVLYKGRDYTSRFSKGELCILEKLCVGHEVVTREELGESFWGEEYLESYSDWALDAIMSRLRKKIDHVGLPINIVTKRGHGYVFG